MAMKMSKAKTPEALIQEQTPELQAMMKHLGSWVRKRAPQLKEGVKWGGVCWIGKGVVCYAHPLEDTISFGFFRGAQLKDPSKILEGKGKFVRSIQVSKPSEFPEKGMAGLLKQAITLDK